jgi:hypothetical protein
MSSKDSKAPELDRKGKEKQNMLAFKIDMFVDQLGEDWPLDDIYSMIERGIDWHDLQNLLEAGCEKELAIKILR